MDTNFTSLVSVCMPTHNNELYISEAIESVLNQSYAAFKFIIVNDGSTDNTQSIIASYADQRISIHIHKHQMGRAASRNRCLQLAQTDVIAFIDADDIAKPFWLEVLMKEMSDPMLTAVCGALRVFGDDEDRLLSFPEAHMAIKTGLLFHNSFAQGGSIVRRSHLQKLHYDSDLSSAEDYDFWRQVVTHGGFLKSIPLVVMNYRKHKQHCHTANQRALLANTKLVLKRCLHGINLDPSDLELDLHYVAGCYNFVGSVERLASLEQWYCKLANQSKLASLVEQHAMKSYIGKLWLNQFYQLCTYTMTCSQKKECAKLWQRSWISDWSPIGRLGKLKLLKQVLAL